MAYFLQLLTGQHYFSSDPCGTLVFLPLDVTEPATPATLRQAALKISRSCNSSTRSTASRYYGGGERK